MEAAFAFIVAVEIGAVPFNHDIFRVSLSTEHWADGLIAIIADKIVSDV